MMAYLWICLGSALGGGCRYWVSGVVAQRFGESFPSGTLFVNVSGCFLIGLIAALTDVEGRFMIAPVARQFLMIGVLGGYTTFSSFSLQTLTLMQDGEWLYAGGNVLLSVILCLVAVWLGHSAGEFLNLSR
jgi:fluoride exporter